MAKITVCLVESKLKEFFDLLRITVFYGGYDTGNLGEGEFFEWFEEQSWDEASITGSLKAKNGRCGHGLN